MNRIVIHVPSLCLRLSAGAGCLLLALAPAVAGDLDFPITRGVKIVLAVHNAGSPPDQKPPGHVAQGDYEVIVTLGTVDIRGVDQAAYIDATDESGTQRQVTVQRTVPSIDLERARMQVLGFLSADQQILPGTTALGPSLRIMRELRENGRSAFSFRNFSNRDAAGGTLQRRDGSVKFPVLVNGRKVELDAVVASGQLSAGNSTRPVEFYFFDHPRHPITLHVAYGPRSGGFPFQPDFARDVVRIDFPAIQASAMSAALKQNCRMEIPGIYFDFDKATIKPQSRPALEQLAEVVRKIGSRHVSVEGHTDDIGGDSYNDSLSARRAAAVKAALTQEFAVQGENISTRGFGSRRPIEPNDSLAGRARNRRVELVLDCAKDGKTR
jgi:outer membrane protein OmpA-like peptidoglycan-associated protein